MKSIKLGGKRGGYAVIDDCDYRTLGFLAWYMTPHGYVARTRTKNLDGVRGGMVYLHRVINRTPAGLSTDHINGNKLDNRRLNLRVATHSTNAMNSKLPSTNTSGARGVSWVSSRRCWLAYITVNGEMRNLGRFKSKVRAVMVRDLAAMRLHGHCARLNNDKAVS